MRRINSLHWVFWLCLLGSIVACRKEELTPRDYPRVRTLPPQVIPDSGVVLRGEVFEPGGAGITDHGFIVGETGKISLGPFSGPTGVFTYFYLGPFSSFPISVMAYVVSANRTVEGNQESFLGQGGPLLPILGFFPTAGVPGDTVLIQIATNLRVGKVFFDQQESKIISATRSEIRCIVPNGIRGSSVPVHLRLESSQTLLTAAQPFRLFFPYVQGISPATASFGDTLTLAGTFLAWPGAVPQVFFDGEPATILAYDTAMIRLIIPSAFTGDRPIIAINNGRYQGTLEGLFRLNPPVITDISLSVTRDFSGLIIRGRNFHPDPQRNTVRQEENIFSVVHVDRQSLSVSGSLYQALQQQPRPLQVTVNGQMTKAVIPYQPSWVKISNAEDRIADGGVFFSVGDWLFMGLGTSEQCGGECKTFSAYHLNTGTWRSLPPYPGRRSRGGKAMLIDNAAYVFTPTTSGSSTYEGWRYDFQNSSWQALADFPVGSSIQEIISVQGRGYALAENGKIWVYNVTDDRWVIFRETPADIVALFGDQDYLYVLSARGEYFKGWLGPTQDWERLPAGSYPTLDNIIAVGQSGQYGYLLVGQNLIRVYLPSGAPQLLSVSPFSGEATILRAEFFFALNNGELWWYQQPR
ncbi:MAG: hypothetical protein H6555_05415 [Lewinellaceae bacterium]|nr:hypothetical protein [Lewinellaceae bacterium]